MPPKRKATTNTKGSSPAKKKKTNVKKRKQTKDVKSKGKKNEEVEKKKKDDELEDNASESSGDIEPDPDEQAVLDVKDEWHIIEMRRLTDLAKQGKPPTPAQLKVFTNPQLMGFLSFNNKHFHNLRKDMYTKIVADYMKNGLIPKCPRCNVRTLRYSNGRKRFGKRYYWCPGYHEPFGYRAGSCGPYHYCGFKADEVVRSGWKCP